MVLIEFYKKAIKEGIKPILGMEAYVVAEGSRFDKEKFDKRTAQERKSNIIIIYSSCKK